MASTAEPASQRESNQESSDGTGHSDRSASSSAPVGHKFTDMEAFEDRLRALDAKLTLVNNIFNLQGRSEPGEANDINYELESSDSYNSDDSDASYNEKRVRKVMDKTVRLLGQLNLSHRQYQRARRRWRANPASKRPLKGGSLTLTDLAAARKISTNAYLEGKPATWGWMHWPEFANVLHLTLQESIQIPFVAVIGELDSQVLDNISSDSADASDILFHPDRDIVTSDPVQRLLPERVKLQSIALRSIFYRLAETDTAGILHESGTVFLRPFKEFIHNEAKLRTHLAELEARFCELKKNGDLSIEAPEAARDIGKERQEYTERHTSGAGTDGVATNVDVAQPGSDSIEALLHLRCLMKFFDDEMKPKLEYFSSDQCRKILFHDLFNRFLNVQSTNEASKEAHDRQTMKIHCAYIDFDGKEFGPVKVTFIISPFGGLKEVDSLPIYPLRLAKDVGLRDRLVSRGRMILEITSLQPMYYTGPALHSGEEIDSQVIVDHSEALADGKRTDWTPVVEHIGSVPLIRPERCVWPCCRTSSTSLGSYIDYTLANGFVNALVPEERFQALPLILSPQPLGKSVLGTEYEPKDEDFLVMTYRVFGFVLRTRKWAQLDLTYLRYENQDARDSTLGAFDRLELPTGHREMVKSLVTQHFRGKRSSSSNVDRTDMVRGKGKGLIMLLHGAPGVGKTTTAGDLGTTARHVEQELEKNFALASRWGCILLIDEADVFLSARERKDFERNGLVAGKCHHNPFHQYYTGILFLTTNRIGDFDKAFVSRIHMSFYYPELEEMQTKKVFKVNLNLIQERFDRQGRKIMYDRSSIENFAEQHFRTHVYRRWNGRQIRNACQTALALAEYDAHGDQVPEYDDETDPNITVALELRHFQLVQKAYLEFAKYLGDIHGTQGDRRAIDYGLRAKTQTTYQAMEPGYPSTPSNAAGFSASRYPARPLFTSYNVPYEGPRYPSQAGQAADASHPPVSQVEMSGSDSAYTAGPTSSMGPQIYQQHGQAPDQTGPGGMFNMQANPQGQGYSYPGNQPGLYQSASQQGFGQSWGSSGPGMNQGYPPAVGLQQGQAQMPNPQWQSPQVAQQQQQQQQQGHSIYRSSNLQQGGGMQGPTTGEGFPVQGQTPYSGQGSTTGA
ncbi:P-loop containing nucleoside triphosphate hydrolase protein [Apiospora marii]|uniref:P-loop containing nucleoside triphosphate hydrolase protein n=1 Tax=Apiospora marii TaxID=335849 RepID=UPI00312F6141